MKMKKQKSGIKFEEIYEGHLIASNPTWKCGLEDDMDTELSLYVEIIDMAEATGEAEFENAPFIVSVEIVAANPHRDFYEGDGEPSRMGLLSDTKSYVGGVPIDHRLIETDRINLNLTNKLRAKDAVIVRERRDSQNGRGAELVYPRFTSAEAAEKWVKKLIQSYGNVLMTMVGFTLDQPINLMGEDGWSIIRKHVSGPKSAA
jgi:hypothetical protein